MTTGALTSITDPSSVEDYDGMIRRAAADPVGRWVRLADNLDNLDNSDPERAKNLPPDVRDRLALPYQRARDILAPHGAVAPMR